MSEVTRVSTKIVWECNFAQHLLQIAIQDVYEVAYTKDCNRRSFFLANKYFLLECVFSQKAITKAEHSE